MRLLSTRRAVLAAAAVAALWACVGSPTDEGVQAPGVAIGGLPATLTVGDTVRATATVRASSGGAPAGAPIVWSSTDESVLTVSSSGLVTAIDDGTARVIATVGSLSGSHEVDVTLQLYPAAVSFTALGVGAHHQCARTEQGAVLCRGQNPRGQLGTGDLVTRPQFAGISVDQRFRQVDSGDENSCALTELGVLYCWGKNSEAEVRPVATAAGVPGAEVIASGRLFRKVSVGQHEGICALGADDVIYCWGHNDQGQVGRAPLAVRDTARAPITSSLRFRDVALGGLGGCGIAMDGGTHCWGRDGRVATIGEPPLPALIPGDRRFSTIAAGLVAYCGLEDGAAYCWGEGADALVSGMSSPYNLPRAVPRIGVAFSSLAVGDGRACALTAAGALYCWGGTNKTPAPVAPRRTFRAIDASWGQDGFCALTTRGEMFCF